MELEYVAEWLNYAKMDLMTAEHLLTMRPLPLEIICYHCQQAAEKYLKGYLVFKGIIEPPKTHDLVLLKIDCMKTDASFESISRACEVLTRYGIQPRYPNEMEITEKDMQNALNYARQIKDFAPLQAIDEELEQRTVEAETVSTEQDPDIE
ncbi:MAG: HEPN domain-containing protein [Oscillospiraceae bacterium]|nr:HEPN domain-containing protein [Oscillospiraceae bacterium]